MRMYRSRHLLLRRELNQEQHQDLQELYEAYPLLKDLRQLLLELYGLYQCSGRDQAMARLRQLRDQAAGQQELCSPELLSALHGPILEKSLVYLDHQAMPATSNAVERSNRRFRKMQKGVYRVRQPHQIRRRLGLDLLREQRAAQRKRTGGRQRGGPRAQAGTCHAGTGRADR